MASRQKETPVGPGDNDLSFIEPFLEQLGHGPHTHFVPWMPLPLSAGGPRRSPLHTFPLYLDGHHHHHQSFASVSSGAPLPFRPPPPANRRHDYNPDPNNHRPASSHSAKTISRHSLASTSTEITHQSSIWDTTTAAAGGSTKHTRPASSVGRWDAGAGDTPDRAELTGEELHVIHQQAAPPASLLLSAVAVIPCEFSRYDGCSATFNAFTEVNAWIRHVREAHLDWDLPPACLCWFCDDFKFIAADGDAASRLENFHSRMEHIAGHFTEAGGAPRPVRPDFHFLDHLWRKGLITPDVFEREKQRGEGMPVEGLRPNSHKTKRMLKEEEQRTRVVVSSREEERQRRRARASNRLKAKV